MPDAEYCENDLFSSRLSYKKGPSRHTVPDGLQLVLSRGRNPVLMPEIAANIEPNTLMTSTGEETSEPLDMRAGPVDQGTGQWRRFGDGRPCHRDDRQNKMPNLNIDVEIWNDINMFMILYQYWRFDIIEILEE
uniref:Uncharacterized protein n=1 Tax=Timema cristinae TaxID=61476 RepID=A0A7R9CTH1_TIMCR|nr:unnamed protein product [Timema cristinae]